MCHSFVVFRWGSFSNAQDFGGEDVSDGRGLVTGALLRFEVEDRIGSAAGELF